MDEIWVNISDYPIYWVSNLGNVKSKKYNNKTNTYKELVLKQHTDKYGYLYVGLSIGNRKIKFFKVHRLVAKYFLSTYRDTLQVNHIDENKTNNKVDNLEMCDNKYNCTYGSRKTLHTKPVLQYSLDGQLVREWSSTREIERVLGFSNVGISNCCRGKLKDSHSNNIYPVHKAYGYIWKYK